MHIFIATRAQDVPSECRQYASVDGSVPGAEATWDHHRSGELINLDAMPERLDPTAFDGVGTTLADMDAAASVVTFLLGGRAGLPSDARAVLESASHWCDHLGPHPVHNEEVNRLGRGLRDAFDAEMTSVAKEEREAVFARFCEQMLTCIEEGTQLPYRPSDEEQQRQRAKALFENGRLRLRGSVAIADLRGVGELNPLVIYALHDRPVGLFIEDHRTGGPQYTIGTNPFVADRPEDLTVALTALAAAEHGHGLPCLNPAPVPGAENWGGRKTVFGSPWNYGSRLEPDEVADIAARSLGLPIQ